MVWGSAAGTAAVQGGATVLLAVVVLMVLTGRLVPRATLTDMRAERDEWKRAHRVSEDSRATSSRQVDALLTAFGALPRLPEVHAVTIPQGEAGEVAANAVDAAAGE